MSSPFERRFRFGVMAATGDPASWRDRARRAADLGYDILLASDHFGRRMAAMPALIAAADAAHIRIGTLVLANDLRAPAITAAEAATADVLSRGRFELGIGSGWLEDDYRAVGMDVPTGAERVERLGEALDIIDALLRGEPVDHSGAHYQVSISPTVASCQPPRLPLLVGGSGQRMLSLAARTADIVSITATEGIATRDRFGRGMAEAGRATAERIEWIRHAAGARFDALELNVLIHECMVTGAPQEALARIAGDTGADPSEVLESPHVLVGSVGEITDRLLARREAYGLSYTVVPVGAMEEMAPVVAHLAGS